MNPLSSEQLLPRKKTRPRTPRPGIRPVLSHWIGRRNLTCAEAIHGPLDHKFGTRVVPRARIIEQDGNWVRASQSPAHDLRTVFAQLVACLVRMALSSRPIPSASLRHVLFSHSKGHARIHIIVHCAALGPTFTWPSECSRESIRR